MCPVCIALKNEYLCKLENTKNKSNIDENAVNAVTEGAEVFIPLDELVDKEKELERLTKEKQKLEDEIKRVTTKLSNEGFVAKAPQKIVDEEKAKSEKYHAMLEKVIESLEKLK